MPKKYASRQPIGPDGRGRSVRVRGEVLQSLRLSRLWTQSETATLSGLSERLIRLAERGGPIELNSVRALSKVFRIPISAIVDDEPIRISDFDAAANARRFLEQIWNFGNLSVIDELLLPEFVFHHENGVVNDQDEMRERIRAFRRSFSDFDFAVQDARTTEAFVVCRWRVSMNHTGTWMSLPPTGRRATVLGSSWVQIVDEKFGDAWDFWDPQSLYADLTS